MPNMSTQGDAWPSPAAGATSASPLPFLRTNIPSLPLAAMPLSALPPDLASVPRLPPAAAAADGNGDEGGNAEEGMDDLPLGYRFCPTDEELVINYLVNKVLGRPLPANIIRDDVYLYKFDAHELPREFRYSMKDECYFFTTRTRKYPNGSRPSRSTPTGYWKATGRDAKVPKDADVPAGYKKTLVFYVGKAPGGSKTNWMMHEFRINEALDQYRNHSDPEKDSYVVCRVYNRETRRENGRRYMIEAKRRDEQ